jgi:hypothetical protein
VHQSQQLHQEQVHQSQQLHQNQQLHLLYYFIHIYLMNSVLL